MTKLERAKEIAEKAHKGQTRWDGIEPYFNHPLRVAKAVKKYGQDAQIVAILHDVVEDTEVTLEGLSEFGEVITQAVAAITKKDKEDYLQYLKRVRENRLASLVKIADITDNLNGLGKQRQRRRAYKLARFILEEAWLKE